MTQGSGNLVFLRVKRLQAAMKGTLCVRGCSLDRFEVNQFSLGVLQRGDANRSVAAAWLCRCCRKTHCNGCMNVSWDLCWGGSWSTKPCVFRVEWLQPAMTGSLCVSGANWLPLGVLQRVVVHVCVVLFAC